MPGMNCPACGRPLVREDYYHFFPYVVEDVCTGLYCTRHAWPNVQLPPSPTPPSSRQSSPPPRAASPPQPPPSKPFVVPDWRKNSTAIGLLLMALTYHTKILSQELTEMIDACPVPAQRCALLQSVLSDQELKDALGTLGRTKFTMLVQQCPDLESWRMESRRSAQGSV